MTNKRHIHIGIVSEQYGNFDRGGAEVQVDNTAHALNKISGISTEFIHAQTMDIERFDIIHFFKSSIAYYPFIRILENHKIPYVVSTIIYPEQKIDVLKYKLIKALPGIRNISAINLQYQLWENANMLFPNTDKELDFLREIGVKNKARIIPNGIITSEMDSLADIDAFYKAFPQLKNIDFVLNVARIDSRKNQYNLVLACKKLNIDLVLIGNNVDKETFKAINGIGYSKLHYLGPIFDKSILYGAYKACKVFCLPSTMETPGIAAMEAAYFNKPIVITKYGGTQYYFGNNARYVEWKSVDDISAGINEKWQAQPTNTKNLIENFSWDNIAKMYYEIYNEILNNI